MQLTLLATAILVMVVVLGFFLPPVSIILMTAPIILPPLRSAGFDLHIANDSGNFRAEGRKIAANVSIVRDLFDPSSLPGIPIAREREQDR